MVEYSGDVWQHLRSTPLGNLDPAIRLPEGNSLESLSQLDQEPRNSHRLPRPRSRARGLILPPWPGYPLLGCSSALPNSVSPGKVKDSSKCSRWQTRLHNQPNAPTGSRQRHGPQNPPDRTLPTYQQEDISGRNPTIHWLVSTRPSVAGINAPRDNQDAQTLIR